MYFISINIAWEVRICFLKKLWTTRKLMSLSLLVENLNFKVSFIEVRFEEAQQCMHMHNPTSRCKIFE